MERYIFFLTLTGHFTDLKDEMFLTERLEFTDYALLWFSVVIAHQSVFLLMLVLALYASAYPIQTGRKSSMCLVQMIVFLFL